MGSVKNQATATGWFLVGRTLICKSPLSRHRRRRCENDDGVCDDDERGDCDDVDGDCDDVDDGDCDDDDGDCDDDDDDFGCSVSDVASAQSCFPSASRWMTMR
jgi:hypothetical protein